MSSKEYAPFTDMIFTKYVEFREVLMYISKTVLFQLFILVWLFLFY